MSREGSASLLDSPVQLMRGTFDRGTGPNRLSFKDEPVGPPLLFISVYKSNSSRIQMRSLPITNYFVMTLTSVRWTFG